MTRRQFTATAAGAACAAAGPSRYAGRIRIAFLGVSHSHGPDKVQLCRESPDWELAGIWEPDSAVAGKYRAAGVRMLTREEILNDPTIPVVAIESAARLHGPLAVAALSAGKHVHLEGPPAGKADTSRIAGLARSNGLLVQVGYLWRHHPGMNALIDAARNGWLGNIFLVHGMMDTLLPDRRSESALLNGRQMSDQSCHLIDPLVRLLGKPACVLHCSRRTTAYGECADASFNWPDALGIVSSAIVRPYAATRPLFAHRMFEVQGSNGTATLRLMEGAPRLEIDLVKAAGPYAEGKQEVRLPAFTRHAGDFQELARFLRNGSPLSVTLQEELDVQETLLAASEMLA